MEDVPSALHSGSAGGGGGSKERGVGGDQGRYPPSSYGVRPF